MLVRKRVMEKTARRMMAQIDATQFPNELRNIKILAELTPFDRFRRQAG